MSDTIIEMRELTDSRELMEAKVHPFVTWFIAILTLLLLAAFIWSYYGQIDIVVKASSVVRPNQQISSINNQVFGQIQSVKVHSGQTVQQGDVLFTLVNQDLDNQMKLLNHNLDQDQTELTQLQSLKNSMLHPETALQTKKQEGLTNYLVSSDTDKNSLALQIQHIQDQLKVDQQQLDHDKLLNQSIKEQKNLLAPGTAAYYQYENYEIQKNEYQQNLNLTEHQFKNQILTNSNPKELKNQVYTAQYNLNNYVSQFHTTILDNIEKDMQSVQDLQNQLSSLYVSFNKKIRSMQDSVNQLENQIAGVKIQSQQRVITAPISGVYNDIQTINKGDVVQAVEQIGTIIPKNNSLYEMKIAVSNHDIANIHVGDMVRFSFQSLPQNEYGMLEGKISAISPDSAVNQQNGVSYYVVKASIENKPLYNKEGQVASIKVGMAAAARIMTRREKIIRLLLDKIKLGN